MEDAIFLLSKDEYEKYEKSIPKLNINWWLRSPGINQCNAAGVINEGCIAYFLVGNISICVRPALYLDKVKIDGYEENRFVYCGITWIKIDDNVAISELPIGKQSFNKSINNDYENSDIRIWLLNWYEKRKNY